MLLGRNLAPINPVRATSGKGDRGEEEMLVGSSVNPIYPGLFWYIRYRGGHIVPPLSILGLSGVRVPILFGNDLPMND